MTESRLYRKILTNHEEIERLGSQMFIVDKDIRMKLKLLDLQIVQGAYIDRGKNLSSDFYEIEETRDKLIYKRAIKNTKVTLE